MNTFARDRLGYNDEPPRTGEPVIGLMNNALKGVYNGQIGRLNNLSLVDEDIALANITMDSNNIFSGRIDLQQFGQNYFNKREDIQGLNYFDWAYCITVWKSQGSEWQNVLLLEEYLPKMEKNVRSKFLYTACTRAKNKLVIFRR